MFGIKKANLFNFVGIGVNHGERDANIVNEIGDLNIGPIRITAFVFVDNDIPDVVITHYFPPSWLWIELNTWRPRLTAAVYQEHLAKLGKKRW